MKPKSLHRLLDRNSASAEAFGRAVKYKQHVDCEETGEDGEETQKQRETPFAFQQEKYEPLMDDDAKEERKKKKKENYKKVKKVSWTYINFLKNIYIFS